MMYYVYLGKVLMPVTPGSITIKTKNRNKTLDLASGGELVIPKSPGLSEISCDFLLPSGECSFARYEDGYKSPNYFLSYFENLKSKRQAFDFIVIRSVSAMDLLRYSARLSSLPGAVTSEFDFDGDGAVTAADARILLRSQNGVTMLDNTNVKCVLEDYTIKEDAEKYGRDFLVSVTMKQYREYGIKTASYSITK